MTYLWVEDDFSTTKKVPILLSLSTALNDQLHAILDYDFFHADRSQFTVYSKKSEVWLKLKYSI